IKGGSYTLTPYLGGYSFDDGEGLENGTAVGLGFGYNYTERLGVEAVFNYVDSEVESTDQNANAKLLRFEGLYHFLPKNKLVPYLAAGLGFIDVNAGNEEDGFSPLVDFGAGLKYSINDSLQLRGDVRNIYEIDGSDNHLLYTVGITYLFGRKEPVRLPVVGKPAEKTVVEKKAPHVPADSDSDGVYDDKDKCPNTPKGIKVDSSGCPMPLTEKVVIDLKVEFDFDKAEIKSIYNDHLQKVANFLSAYPDAEGVIEGHTDSIGTEKYNHTLSHKRAENVRQYLIDNFGIKAERLKAIGYGESRPIADNKTKEGRQKNRRVIGTIATIITK
ncbi:MAG: peptidoglycan-binding outer membrane protein, partial [Nitrospirae bacterium]|nr:peptidoglycan-binding outer membrane protein [Nitrospirota bacterium]